ncbi:MAG: Trk system potassium transporter TrkA [Candidatus Omnitrophica bacterium]|nr:Trk system potassium transporter TrkA [Candidatus Omnitrophota bacterium]
MKVVITGVGETGFYLAQILLKEGHDLILIEKDEKAFHLAQERLDAQIILGDAANALILEPLVDESTDLMVALTNNDSANIISTLIARKFGAKRAIVRVSDSDNLIHPLLTDDPSVSVLNAEIAVTKDLVRLIANPSADEIEYFANGKAQMIKLHVEDTAAILGKKLKDIKVPHSWLIVAAIRDGSFQILSGDSTIQKGDHVLVVGDPKNTKEIEELLGLKPVKVRRVIIIGFNAVSKQLAMTLTKQNIEVRLIEENQELAEKASGELDGVLVFHGDGTSEEILEQAGIDQTDYLLALTQDNETNVLISLLGKEEKVPRVIAMIQKHQYKPIVEKVGVDSVVHPRSAMVEEIIRLCHRKELSGIYILEGGKGTVMEFEIKKKTKAVDVPLSKLKLPKQTLIGGIVRNDELIVPRGNDKIKIGDRIVVFTTRAVLADARRLFSE